MSTTMKKIMSFLLLMLATCSLAACGKSDRKESPNNSGQMKEQTEKQTAEESETNESGSKQTEQDGAKKILVAYFSWADNAVQDDIDAMTSPSVKVPGDVAQLASWIGEETGGLASSVKDISVAIPDAKISDHVFDVYEEDAASAKDEIVEWIKSTSAN